MQKPGGTVPNTNRELSVFNDTNPLLTIKFRASIIPIRNPLATIAGIMGTKMSPSVLMARLKIFCWAAAACFTSAFVAADRPDTCRNSS